MDSDISMPEQRRDEPDRAYRYLCHYLGSGPGRSIALTAAQCDISTRYARVLSSKWDWDSRAVDHDKAANEAFAAAAAAENAEVIASSNRLVASAIDKALAIVDNIDPADPTSIEAGILRVLLSGATRTRDDAPDTAPNPIPEPAHREQRRRELIAAALAENHDVDE